jgi:transposase
VEAAQKAGMQVAIPPKKNRMVKRDCDAYLYRLRHLVENAFLALKRWRGIATRYAKNTASFLAAVPVRCIAIWSSIY